MQRVHSAIAGTPHRMKVVGVIIIMMVVVTGICLVYFIRPVIGITNEPVNVLDTPSDQHVVIYVVDINGNNITVGEIGLTWSLLLLDNTSEYDTYEFALYESVRGSAADEGGVGWIEGGRTFIELRSENLMLIDWSDSYGEGAVEVTASTNSSWDGSIEWRFQIMPGAGTFNPRAATNVIDFSLSILAIHATDVNFTIHAFTDWSIYGYSFDRVYIHGLETVAMDQTSMA